MRLYHILCHTISSTQFPFLISISLFLFFEESKKKVNLLFHILFSHKVKEIYNPNIPLGRFHSFIIITINSSLLLNFILFTCNQYKSNVYLHIMNVMRSINLANSINMLLITSPHTHMLTILFFSATCTYMCVIIGR